MKHSPGAVRARVRELLTDEPTLKYAACWKRSSLMAFNCRVVRRSSTRRAGLCGMYYPKHHRRALSDESELSLKLWLLGRQVCF